MEDKPIVVGAGMAGLLAAGMLRGDCKAVFEQADSLPNNHSAVLRFRSSVVGDALNIPFKKVTAVKAVHPWRNAIADAVAYSRKTNGSARLRSIISADARTSERYIAPVDLIARMENLVQCEIKYGSSIDEAAQTGNPIISTIPMPSLMEYLGWDGGFPEFNSRSGVNYSATVCGADMYCSLYVPDPSLPFARISVTGDRLVAECYQRSEAYGMKEGEVLRHAAYLLGLGSGELRNCATQKQTYGKILPIDEGERRAFITWASEKHDIYSLGRYATWRPSLLLDDVVNDVRVIQRLITNKGESYAHKLKGRSS